MASKKHSRNAPCPCGSGKKYKHCCYGKGVEDDLGLGSHRSTQLLRRMDEMGLVGKRKSVNRGRLARRWKPA
jgi:hypothetical protein